MYNRTRAYNELSAAMAIYIATDREYRITARFNTKISLTSRGGINIQYNSNDEQSIDNTEEYIKKVSKEMAVRFITNQQMQKLQEKGLLDQKIELFERQTLQKEIEKIQDFKLEPKYTYLAVFQKLEESLVQNTLDFTEEQVLPVEIEALFMILALKKNEKASDKYKCKVVISNSSNIIVKGSVPEDIESAVHYLRKFSKEYIFKKLYSSRDHDFDRIKAEAFKKKLKDFEYFVLHEEKVLKIRQNFRHLAALTEYIDKTMPAGLNFVGGIFKQQEMQNINKIKAQVIVPVKREPIREDPQQFMIDDDYEPPKHRYRLAQPRASNYNYDNYYNQEYKNKYDRDYPRLRQRQDRRLEVKMTTPRHTEYERVPPPRVTTEEIQTVNKLIRIDALVFLSFQKFSNFRKKLEEMQQRYQTRIKPTYTRIGESTAYYLNINTNKLKLKRIIEEFNFFFSGLCIMAYEFEKQGYIEGNKLNQYVKHVTRNDPDCTQLVVAQIRLTENGGRLYMLSSSKQNVQKSQMTVEKIISKIARQRIQLLERKSKHIRVQLQLID